MGLRETIELGRTIGMYSSASFAEIGRATKAKTVYSDSPEVVEYHTHSFNPANESYVSSMVRVEQGRPSAIVVSIHQGTEKIDGKNFPKEIRRTVLLEDSRMLYLERLNENIDFDERETKVDLEQISAALKAYVKREETYFSS